MKRFLMVIVPALLMLATVGAFAQDDEDSTVLVAEDPVLGPILTDAEGMTLYLFTNDTTEGESTESTTRWKSSLSVRRATFCSVPVERSSRAYTSSPESSRSCERWEPMKPAPPVTSALSRSCTRQRYR